MERQSKIASNILECIGKTPIVKMNKIPLNHGIKCQLFAKLEFFNPGGSVKDRIGYNMITQAENEKKTNKNTTFVECTSGNTGIGVVMTSVVKGYKSIITIPDKMSNEKINILRALGSDVKVCPTDAADDDPENYHLLAHTLGDKKDNIWLDQYTNKHNPESHELTTGPEIVDQMDGKIDYIFIAAGTGGTVTGLTRYLHEKIPGIKVIGIDPIGSILAYPDSLNEVQKMYKQEGIGQSEMPSILEREKMDEWIKTTDAESFRLSRELIKTEGYLSGGSCGAVLQGCFSYLKKNNLQDNENLRCVVIMPDGIGNYITKFPRDEWMVGCGFEKPELIIDEKNYFYGKKLKDFPWIKEGIQKDINEEFTVKQALQYFEQGNETMVVLKEGKINSVIDSQNLNNLIFQKNLKMTDSVLKTKNINFLLLPCDIDFSGVWKMLQNETYAILVDQENDVVKRHWIVTRKDLLRYFSEADKNQIIIQQLNQQQ